MISLERLTKILNFMTSVTCQYMSSLMLHVYYEDAIFSFLFVLFSINLSEYLHEYNYDNICIQLIKVY